jgi:hypothetical protein
LHRGGCCRQFDIENIRRYVPDLLQRLTDSVRNIRVEVIKVWPAHNADAWFEVRFQGISVRIHRPINAGSIQLVVTRNGLKQ